MFHCLPELHQSLLEQGSFHIQLQCQQKSIRRDELSPEGKLEGKMIQDENYQLKLIVLIFLATAIISVF